MPGFMEKLATINSFVRTLLAVVVLGAVGYGGWFGYATYNAKEIEAQKKSKELEEATGKLADAQRELDAAEAEITQKSLLIIEKDSKISELNLDIEKLEASLALLKVDHRLARLTVVDQGKDPNTGESFSRIEFVELNDEGVPI